MNICVYYRSQIALLRKCAGIGLLALFTVAPALCQTTPDALEPAVAPSTPEQQRQIAEQFVHDKLAIWRKTLALEEWQISIVMARRDALKSSTLGGIKWDKGKKTAVISVMDVSEYRLPFEKMLDDMEFTIVHELIHLELASLPRSEASRGKEEHAVNRMTEALLKLAREKH